MLHNSNKTSMAKPSMVHELLRNSLSVLEGTISENPYLQQVSRNRLLSFYQAKKEEALSLITNRPRKGSVSSWFNKQKVNPFRCD